MFGLNKRKFLNNVNVDGEGVGSGLCPNCDTKIFFDAHNPQLLADKEKGETLSR